MMQRRPPAGRARTGERESDSGDAHFMDVAASGLGPLCRQAAPAGAVTVRVEQVTCAVCLRRLNALLADLRNRRNYADGAQPRDAPAWRQPGRQPGQAAR